ncbi:MAG: T9SS type A sorting domain-containing protein [Bacteroidales bacterium]|nr:T9SS type A sorting domain-containing protein [Bacteroidales bacterium]
MKKFNFKTLVIGLLIIIGLFLIVFKTFGQDPNHTRVLNPPTDLFATIEDENDVNLFWTAPSTGSSTYLHWDSGENEDSFGNFIMPVTTIYAAKYDPAHITAYDGWEITKFRFWVANPLPTVKLKVLTGPNATEVYSQNVASFNVNNWTEITLTTPFTIDASTQLWIGLEINMPVPGQAIGTDGGPGIDGYGNMYYQNGIWWHDFSLNWNLQALVESADSKTRESLLGYDIYRDEVKLNQETWTSTSYVDENLLNGTYDYYVKAVYDDGVSDPSNMIEVQVNQPVIAYADSMALVDLYNNCDGPNWLINTLWLEGPVNEWAGVVTTGTRVTQLWLQSKGITGAIPESIGDLTALKNMVLSSNPITSIPETIGDLSSLEMLWLGWTDITSVPESIGNLTNLNELHLGLMNNPLTSLPDSFCNLESLEWLALGGNALTSLPSCFGNLSSLETLFIWENMLTELPESFGNLQSLWHLNMDYNPITHLPDNFGDLDNLESLRMEGNLLTALPESFSDLENLEIVWGRNNQIEALPEAFGNLDSLIFINLSSNVITEFPASITDLASIRELLFDNNEIAYIPEDIGSLSTLEVLGLIGNNIAAVPESLATLGALEILGLAHNYISTLPDSFGNLEADSLYLNNNLINELPATMFDNAFDMLLLYENQLQFGSIEPFVGQVLYNFAYAPQGLIGNDTLVEVIEGQDMEYTLEVSGENNAYQWYRDSVAMSGQNTNTLLLENVNIEDEGFYYLEVTNSLATELILTSHLIEVVIGTCNPWTFQAQSAVHTIAIPASANPNIGGEPLMDGDWIGVFFLNEESVETCGGATMWNSAGVEVLAYGDNPFAPGKQGFDDGEAFIWKMYRCADQLEETAVATYDPGYPNEGYFANQGSSALTSLSNGYIQSFDMVTGWNSASSYIVPDNPAVEDILSPIVNNLILMRNLTQVYWPTEGINTIGNWDNNSGYAMKFSGDATFDIAGSTMADQTITVPAGWSYLPVPSECDVDVAALFGPWLDDVVIIQDLIGTQVFWPALGVYTLEYLVPGTAYKIKTTNEIQLTFPECENRQTTSPLRTNTLSSPWSELKMTPSTETVLVYNDAIRNFLKGDIIAAFNQAGDLCGMLEITGNSQNNALILFGDDPLTSEIEGLQNEETVQFKLYKQATGETFELSVEYDWNMENYDGYFRSNTLAGIQKLSLLVSSVGNMDDAQLNFYPNPASNQIHIHFGNGIQGQITVEIYNMQGGLVQHRQISNSSTTINVRNFENGIYTVKFSATNFTRIEKLVIQ